VLRRVWRTDIGTCVLFPSNRFSISSTIYLRRSTKVREKIMNKRIIMIITGEPTTWAGPPFCRVNTTLYLHSSYTTPTIAVRAGARPAAIPPLEEKPYIFPKTAARRIFPISRTADWIFYKLIQFHDRWLRSRSIKIWYRSSLN